MARDIAFTHHERFDGAGYPFGLQGKQIPLCGRITALSDVYDALRSQRVYKPKFSHEKARQIILDGMGTQFDPDVVEAFLRREEEIIRISESLAEPAEERPGVQTPLPATTPEPALDSTARGFRNRQGRRHHCRLGQHRRENCLLAQRPESRSLTLKNCMDRGSRHQGAGQSGGKGVPVRRPTQNLLGAALCLLGVGSARADGIILDGVSAYTIGRGGTNIGFADNGSILHDNPAAMGQIESEGMFQVRRHGVVDGVSILRSRQRRRRRPTSVLRDARDLLHPQDVGSMGLWRRHLLAGWVWFDLQSQRTGALHRAAAIQVVWIAVEAVVRSVVHA